VRTWRVFRAGGGQACVRGADFARQGAGAKDARHVFRRHGRERQGHLRGRGQGSGLAGAGARSLRADAGISGTEAAAGQQAGVRRGPEDVADAVLHGEHQLAQCAPVQHADGLSVWARVRLRRDADRRSRRGRRSRGQAHRAANSRMAASAVPKPGEGPSKEERENGLYDLLYVAIAPDGRQVRASVKGDRDPGYGSTSKMISECAICLLRDTPEVPAGIWTPGAAMQHRLIKRLVDNAGLTFAVET